MLQQCTDRNHGSPVAVDVWSSIASEDLVVYNIIGGVDGHNYSAVCDSIFRTEGVFEGAIVCFSTSLDNDYDVSGGFLIRVNGQSALAVLNSMTAILSVYRDLRIFVALVSDPSIDGTFYLLNLTVSVNNGNGNFVVLADSAAVGAEFKGLIGVGISNSQGLFNELFLVSVECNNLNGGTDERFVCRDILLGSETIVPALPVRNSLTIKVEAYIIGCINFQPFSSTYLALTVII